MFITVIVIISILLLLFLISYHWDFRGRDAKELGEDIFPLL